jgi:uncharacterized membrane-anchored protein YjiN (DUF445 family)
MAYKSVYKEIEVDVDLEDFDDDELIDELGRRGLDYITKGVDGDSARELLEKIWQNRRENKPFDSELDSLIYAVLGKIV